VIHKLGILRHGSASMYAPNDELRPLTDVGKNEVHHAAQNLPFEPVVILHSPLLRAEQTAAIVHSYYPTAKLKCVDFLIPEYDPKACFEALSSFKDQQVLIVSHQPLVSKIINIAIDGMPGSGAPYGFLNPANFMVLTFDVFAAGCANLVDTYLR
jgi:phosphohistidine phosphatase